MENYSVKCVPYSSETTKTLKVRVKRLNDLIEVMNSLNDFGVDGRDTLSIAATLIHVRNCIQNQIEERKVKS